MIIKDIRIRVLILVNIWIWNRHKGRIIQSIKLFMMIIISNLFIIKVINIRNTKIGVGVGVNIKLEKAKLKIDQL